MAAASLHVMNLDQFNFEEECPSFLNVGSGEEITIKETAQIIADLVGFKGETVYNQDQPDGTPRKLMDSSRLNKLGWKPLKSFSEGLENTYQWYKAGLKISIDQNGEI